MLRTRREKIIEAYFSKSPEKCYSALEEATGIPHLEKKDSTEVYPLIPVLDG
ncbi:MAG: hypothetical protein ACTSUQ_11605 [Candidatus Freyarchaeota archaeon]